MKKIAAIFLLFVFALAQAGPVLSSFFSDSSYVLVVDEDKGKQKSENEKKDKKDFIAYAQISPEFSHLANTTFHLSEKIQFPPSLEKLIPPPNFY